MGSCVGIQATSIGTNVHVDVRSRHELPNWTRPETPVTSEMAQLIQKSWELVRKHSTATQFYDRFFENWSNIDSNVNLYFRDVKTRSEIMARMLSFMVKYCQSMATVEVQQYIRRIACVHVQSGVPPYMYDSLARTLLTSMKQSLGFKFTHDINVQPLKPSIFELSDIKSMPYTSQRNMDDAGSYFFSPHLSHVMSVKSTTEPDPSDRLSDSPEKYP